MLPDPCIDIADGMIPALFLNAFRTQAGDMNQEFDHLRPDHFPVVRRFRFILMQNPFQQRKRGPVGIQQIQGIGQLRIRRTGAREDRKEVIIIFQTRKRFPDQLQFEAEIA